MKIKAIITVAIEVTSTQTWESEDTKHLVDNKAKHIVNEEVNKLLTGDSLLIERPATIKIIKIDR